MWDDEIDYVLEEIERSGQQVIWKSLTNGAGANPWQPTNGTSTEYNVNMCFVPNSKLQYWNGTEIAVGETIGLMGYVEDFTPKIKDIVLRNGKELSIKNIKSLEPADKVVLYKVVFE